MSIKRHLKSIAIALPLMGLIAGPADAHRRWLLPSATVMSGEKEVVTFDAASSNELFVFDHRAMPLNDLVVLGPDGKAIDAKILGSGATRSSFDVEMAKQGTYRIALVNGGLMAFYKLGQERKRWRGTAEELDSAFPEGATDINISLVSGRTETFATLGAPNETALAPTNQGLEMVPVSHPNDLVVGEAAQFKFLIDGKPAADMEIEWVRGGTRYRDTVEDMNLKTDAAGIFEVTVDEPGLYYLEASVSDDEVSIPKVNSRRSSYSAVLEFLPL
ncbi:DUF4198 domain-containing protein [Parasphingorhabdus sp.]|uniref:DUF4198 domain-containing protein n=1 Tax=Parasphingorhabdus sp. TaxID=2709688 RepID=UPI002F92BA2B